MDEVRLINAIPLEKEMLEYADYIGPETTNECESTAETCADMVSEAPTIDPESLRPVAHWLGKGMDVHCSECNNSPIMDMDVDVCWFWRFCPKFCPNCGAKMEGFYDD